MFGVCVLDGDWIFVDCDGLMICDVILVVFVQDLLFDKFDVVMFFWQKVFGGEVVYGVLIFSLRVVEWLESYILVWLLLKIFCLIKGGKLIEGIFCGEMINMLFMLCVEDYFDVLKWVEDLGGFLVLQVCVDGNLKVFEIWVECLDWIVFLVEDIVICFNIFVCLKVVDFEIVVFELGQQVVFVKVIVFLLDSEGVVFDIGVYCDVLFGLWIWVGVIVEVEDFIVLMVWFDWVFDVEKVKLFQVV